jgi:hypothetical protein
VKLLHITVYDEVDEVLMVVPDDYDRDKATDTANDYLGAENAEIKGEFQLPAYNMPYGIQIDEYRPFIG